VLTAALVTPVTGPLARFGRAGAEALRLWADRAGGVPLSLRPVDLWVEDAHPDPAAAMRRAAARKPDVVFGPYGSSPALAVARATERLVWNHGGATSALCWPAVPNVVNVLAPASTYLTGALEVVRAADPGAREVRVVHASTGFARDVAAGAVDAASRLGVAAVSVEFEPGGAAAAAAATLDVPSDVVLFVGAFEDDLSAAPVLAAGLASAVALVGAGVDEVLAPLGALREGLLGPAQWVPEVAPEPDEGPPAAWFVRAYRSATGVDPSYPAAQAFVAGVVAARCIRDGGGTGDDPMLAAARALRCRTLLGEFRLDPETGLQVGHRVLTVQWQEGRRRVVWPPEVAERPLAHPRLRSP
jgi:branched-chain amino acid transport system substrate-binding protein